MADWFAWLLNCSCSRSDAAPGTSAPATDLEAGPATAPWPSAHFVTGSESRFIGRRHRPLLLVCSGPGFRLRITARVYPDGAGKDTPC
jgi:hypothetical protein